MTIIKVWINEGCISCHACEAECYEVFRVTDNDCVINSDVLTTGIASNNRDTMVALRANLDQKIKAKIVTAAASCPVNVIKFEIETQPKKPTKIQSIIDDGNNLTEPTSSTTEYYDLPLPSLKLYDESKKIGKDKEGGAVGSAVNKVVVPNDINVPIPTAAVDNDLIKLQELLGSKIEEVFQQAGEITCQVSKENIFEALLLCKDDPALSYEMLADQTGVHYHKGKNFSFSVVYHLTSISRNKRLRLRILIPEGFEPDSATPVYPAANWLEREIWDMFGICFKNHPNMTRILCPEDWEGHPLRKDYPVEGLGQRNIDFREDRGGVLMRTAIEKASNIKLNANRPKAE